MPRFCNALTLFDAKRMLEAGEAKASTIGIAYNIAVVDAGGALIAFICQDGALIGSIDRAIGRTGERIKAHESSTHHRISQTACFGGHQDS